MIQHELEHLLKIVYFHEYYARQEERGWDKGLLFGSLGVVRY